MFLRFKPWTSIDISKRPRTRNSTKTSLGSISICWRLINSIHLVRSISILHGSPSSSFADLTLRTAAHPNASGRWSEDPRFRMCFGKKDYGDHEGEKPKGVKPCHWRLPTKAVSALSVTHPKRSPAICPAMGISTKRNILQFQRGSESER